MKQECEVRQRCWEVAREKQPLMREFRREFNQKGQVVKDNICGFESMGTVPFCIKRERYLVVSEAICPSCGSEESHPYEDKLICDQCGTIYQEKGETE